MAKTVSDTLRETLLQVAREALGDLDEEPPKRKGGLSSGKGLLAGIGLVAAASLAKRALDALRGDQHEPSGGQKATGGGRRMPVQQAVDVEVSTATAYTRFTRFEDWPQFMHRVTRVTQEDDGSVSFATKIWGRTKEFEATIETQRPDERIEWKVSEGITHAGVVTFHELAPDRTRMEVTLDVEPGSLIEKAARGMRDVKRAMRSDLHRFKAFVEMQEREREERPEPARRARNRFASENGHGKPERVGSGGGRRAR